eukprot:7213026-Prymnesium_polylepis.1
MLLGRGSQGATGRSKEDRRVKHFCSGKKVLVERSPVGSRHGAAPPRWPARARGADVVPP